MLVLGFMVYNTLVNSFNKHLKEVTKHLLNVIKCLAFEVLKCYKTLARL